MQKLVLRVSEKVPAIPAAARKEGGLTVQRVSSLGGRAPGAQTLVAYLLDRAFIEKNAEALRGAELPPGSVLLWNPRADASPASDILPDPLVFDEVFSFKRPALFLRTLRNLYRKLLLERELARSAGLKKELAEQKGLLKRRETENSELLQIGIALSAERDNDKLLNDILRQLRQITSADAGTLYLLERDEQSGAQKMRFKITQNDSNPRDFSEFVMDLSTKTISGYVASTGKVLNIEDVYEIPPEIGYGFGKKYDEDTGYRSKSMLTVPMKDHKGEILGVVQLINRKTDFACRLARPSDVDGCVIPFDPKSEPLVMSLASQAAVSLENNLLYQEIERLFKGFVDASVKAIESRDPVTRGHSRRVEIYTVDLALAVNAVGSGPYRDTRFSPEQIKEISVASLLHDFGKVGVKENVLVKARKLYPEQLELVRQRFSYIRRAKLYDLLERRFEALRDSGMDAYLRQKEDLDREERGVLAELDSYLQTIVASDVPTVLPEDAPEILDRIRKETFTDESGATVPYLTGDEYTKLQIRKGSLDAREFEQIQDHVTHTYEFLKTIPWTREMKNIPSIAYGHHEKLDGKGYPRRLPADAIPVQSRMMTISDIYDALTASDRPYKPAVPPLAALDILGAEVKRGQLDEALVGIFIEAKLWQKKPETKGS